MHVHTHTKSKEHIHQGLGFLRERRCYQELRSSERVELKMSQQEQTQLPKARLGGEHP